MTTSQILEPAITDQSQPLRLALSRIFRAPRESVFDAWIRPERIRQWLCPGRMTVTEIATEATDGGAYSITMQGMGDCTGEQEGNSVQQRVCIRGTYEKIVPYSLLRFTWCNNARPEETTTITLHFSDVADGTLLELVQETFLTAESSMRHNSGWTSCFSKLEAMLGSE